MAHQLKTAAKVAHALQEVLGTQLEETAGAESVAARWSSSSGKVDWLVIVEGAPIATVNEGHLLL